MRGVGTVLGTARLRRKRTRTGPPTEADNGPGAPVAPAVGENEQVADEGVQLQPVPHQRVQTVEAPAHVARRQAQVYAHAGRKVDHARRISTTVRSVAASTPAPIRSRSPVANTSSNSGDRSEVLKPLCPPARTAPARPPAVAFATCRTTARRFPVPGNTAEPMIRSLPGRRSPAANIPLSSLPFLHYQAFRPAFIEGFTRRVQSGGAYEIVAAAKKIRIL